MRLKGWLWSTMALLAALLALAACGGSAAETVEVTRVVMEVVMEEGSVVEVTRVVVESVIETFEMDTAGNAASPAPGVAQATPVPSSAAPGSSQPQQRLIIKDGRMIITVVDATTAVNRATELAVGLGGYIISQNMHAGDQGYTYATMRLAVPVDQFEFALRELRNLGEVTDESSSGEDVTDEYVDLNARLTNLQATQQRLLEFLDAAETIDEILEVNEELTRVEEDLAVIQGRLNFLRDRAAFSTIDLTLNPLLPTPTPSPTPTATPLPTPQTWLPGDTAETAVVQLQNTAQNVADFTIFYGIMCGPWLLLLLLLAWVALWLRRWWSGRGATVVAQVNEGGANDEA